MSDLKSSNLDAMKIAHSIRQECDELQILARAFHITGNTTVARQLYDIANLLHDKSKAISDAISDQIQSDCAQSKATLGQTVGLALKLALDGMTPLPNASKVRKRS